MGDWNQPSKSIRRGAPLQLASLRSGMIEVSPPEGASAMDVGKNERQHPGIRSYSRPGRKKSPAEVSTPSVTITEQP